MQYTPTYNEVQLQFVTKNLTEWGLFNHVPVSIAERRLLKRDCKKFIFFCILYNSSLYVFKILLCNSDLNCGLQKTKF